jgi:hypothetical protein
MAGGLINLGLRLSRTVSDRLWPLSLAMVPLAVGLFLSDDGFPDAMGDGSNWKGLPLLLLVEDALVDACDN